MTFKYSFSHNFEDGPLVERIVADFRENKEAFVLVSSGSTGSPKKVKLSRNVLEWSATQSKYAFDLKNEKVFCCLPIDKTGGFMQLFRALYFGWEIHFTHPNSNPLAELDENHNFSTVSLSPQQLFYSLEKEPKKLNRFKVVLVGGASIGKALQSKIDRFHSKYKKVTLYETYGMTETASHIAFRNASKNEKYFTPANGVFVSVDEKHRLIINILELDLKILTNDIGLISLFGFKVLGRYDHVINSGGIKIHPGKLELKIGLILQNAGIERDFYVTKKTDPVLGEEVVLVIEGHRIKDEAFLHSLFKRELPEHHSPREIIYEEKFEHGDTGKVIRKTFGET